MTGVPIRMLFFPRETYPTERVRLTILFGRELFSRGHAIDLVMHAQDASVAAGRVDWYGRSVWIGPTCAGAGILPRLRREVMGVWHDLRHLLRVRRRDYDCVLISDKYLLGAVAALVLRPRGVKFLFWMTFPYHTAQVTLGREGIARHPLLDLIRGHVAEFVLRRWILPRSDHVFVQSATMAEDFAAYGIERSRMTPIVTGIDLAGVTPKSPSAPRRDSGEITVAYLGTMVRERRLEVLVDMLAELRHSGLAARLLFVGDGAVPDDRRFIEQRAQQLGVAAFVEITGFLPRREALARIRDADIGVSPFFPSPILDVASPTKLVEYLALGLPVVANSHPDQSAVLGESRAGVCVPWGARHFARGVRWLARRNAGELAQMSEKGREWVDRHRSYASIADDFEKACRQVLATA